MKVRSKLAIGFSVIVVLIWIAVFSAVNINRGIQEQLAIVGEDIIPDVITIVTIHEKTEGVAHGVMEYIISGKEDDKEAIQLKMEFLKKSGLEHQAGMGADRETMALEMNLKIGEFNSAVAGTITLKEQGVSTGELLKRDREIVHPAMLALLEQVNKHRAYHMETLAEAEDAFQEARLRGMYILFLSAGLVTLIGIAAAIFTTRSIVRPLYALRKGTEMIEQGNLDYKVGTGAKDEIGQLSRAFDQMTRSLTTSMTSVDNLNREITERKKMEEALQESEERYRTIFERSSDSIVLTDMETKTMVDFNDKAHENLGYSRQEFARLKIADIDALESPEEISKRREKISTARTEVFETKHRTRNGKIRDVLLSATPLNIGGKKYVLGIWHDITAQKKWEENLEKTMANLEHSNAQLAAANKEMEAFSYSVSHDLRTPLRTIDGFSQALLEDYPDKIDETGQDYLRRLRTASQKMGVLIDGLLKLSRLSRGKMHREKVDLSALAREIADELKQAQPKRRTEVIISQGLTATGDRQLLRVALANLLGNAWKFTGKRQQARIEFGATPNGGKKAYFVRDNGAGFDMTYADNLFGAFQRLHDIAEFPGTGIGLATVQRIIHRHGGRVWAEGQVGEGATFYFTLS